MREIKFRGKRINRNNEWAYGDLRHSNGDFFIFPQDKEAAIDRDLVDPNSIGQYTGMKDKNRNEIWEGDIVRSISDWGDFGKIGEVVFINGKFMLDTHDDFFGGKYRYKEFVEKEEWEDFKARMEIRFEYEVIGNVIDKNIQIKVGDCVTLTDQINNGQRVKVEEIQDNGYIVYNGGVSNKYKVF